VALYFFLAWLQETCSNGAAFDSEATAMNLNTDILEQLDHLAWQREMADAKARLSKLTVKELRVLGRHYFGQHFGVEEMRKADLVDELCDEIVADERL
jgi:hypothetical protein